MTVRWKPEGYTSVSPYLVTPNAQQVIDFLVAVLGATPLRRYENKDGSIMHAEMRVDDSVIMLGEAGDGWPAMPMHIHVYVADVDAAYRTAINFGATSVQEPTRKDDDSDKRGGVRDAGGNTWWLASQMPSR